MRLRPSHLQHLGNPALVLATAISLDGVLNTDVDDGIFRREMS